MQTHQVAHVEVVGLALRHVGRHAGQLLADGDQVVLAERGDRHPVLGLVLPDQVDGRLDDRLAAVGLQLDDQVRVRERLEDLAQRRVPHALTGEGRVAVCVGPGRAGVERLQLFDGELGHGAGPVRGAVDRAVVDRDDLPVGGDLQVHLQGVGAEVERRLERLQGVRRRVSLRAGVGDDRDLTLGEVRHGLERFGLQRDRNDRDEQHREQHR
jgi:hypothetical protein